MNAEELAYWRKAGHIAAKAIDHGASLIVKGAVLREVCDAVDEKIIALGGKPAWPSQISCDDVAAHYTADPDEETEFERQLVSLDVGCHVDGYIGDNALTIDLSGNWHELVQAARKALDAAIATVRAGVTVGEVSKAIQDAIAVSGFSPVRNLTGHGISRWVIHDSPGIPNYASGSPTVLKEGQVIAIEPFVTPGKGLVHEVEQQNNLFALVGKKPTRSPITREVLAFVEKEYHGLPFTTRWLSPKFGLPKTQFALREMLQLGMLHPYPPLAEVSGGMTAVFEKTMLVKDGKPEILTDYEF
jgi:methionyl aminopeptidase